MDCKWYFKILLYSVQIIKSLLGFGGIRLNLKNSLNFLVGRPETSSSRQANEVSLVVPQGGGFPFAPDPNLASTSGSRIDKGKAPMQEY